jgi:hypothetical protein
MTRDEEAFFAMSLKVKNFGVKNTASLAVVPAVATYFTQLGTLVTQLIAADAGSRADLTGYAMSKSTKRSALETLALKVSNAISSYAVINSDVVLQKRADFPSSKWYLCSEEELVTHATVIKNLASSLPAAALVPYGATAADVTALTPALTAFTDVISDPTLAIDQRKEDNKKVVGTIDAIRTMFSDKLDVLMRSFEVNNSSLYSMYSSARAIDLNGSAATPTAVVDVAPTTVKTVHTAASYNADTFYTLQNMGTAAVLFSLSSTTNVEGDEKTVLNAGETRSRLASNLAPMGVFLVVNNTNAVPVTVRVWVE